MNQKARRWKVQKCVVCGYKYSDKHHVYPKAKGGRGTIVLCPNHHRYANVLQVILGLTSSWDFSAERPTLASENAARRFAADNFDEEFNAKVLDRLIEGYTLAVSRVQDAAERNRRRQEERRLSPQTLTTSLAGKG